jgi:integrase/recombinase XerC
MIPLNVTAAEPYSTTGGHMIEDYRNHLIAAGRAAGTVHQRMFHLAALHRERGDLLKIAERDLEQFLAARSHQKPEYRKALRASFRVFYKWAHRLGHIAIDPAAELLPVRIPRALPNPVADLVVHAALRDAPQRDRAMILLGRLAGLRLSEIASLHTDQRRFDVLYIIGKGNKQRRVTVNRQLAVILDAVESRNGHGYYFPGRWTGHMHKDAVGKVIRARLGQKPHTLRHAAASAGYARTHDIRAVHEFLGHASVATTQLYTAVGLEDVRAVTDATELPPAA